MEPHVWGWQQQRELKRDGSEMIYGSAPDASLVDVRIGTDVGAGPFENYVISQDFYESALNEFNGL